MKFGSLLSFVPGLLVCVAAFADSPTTAPTTEPTSQPASITWDQAKDYIGKTVTVTGPVVGTHSFSDTAVVLNVGKDFPDAGRLTIYVKGEDLPEDLDNGKTVSVTGKIILFHNVPEIQAKLTDVTVVAGATTEPATQPATQP